MKKRKKMKSYFGRLVLLNLIILPTLSFVQADTLETKDGRILQGKYKGGTQQSVRFQTDSELMTIGTSELLALTFTGPPSTASAAPTASATVAPVAAAGPVTIPAGTVLLVTTTSQVSSEDAPGRRFSATLGSDMLAGSVVVAAKGSTVYGQVGKTAQAGRMVGKSKLELYLSEIDIKGIRYPLMTTNFAQAGKSSFRKTARNVGVGALIGGAFGDSDDAKKGAAIGAGLSAVRKGETVVIPTGTLLEFRMTQPLTITQ
jgi:hypothetical protein